MVEGAPAYDEPELLERVRKAARDAELGGHREAFARMLARVRGDTLILGLVTAVLAAATVAMSTEFLTRTDQTGGKVADAVGLLVVVPLAVLCGFAFVVNLYRGLFGPATARAVRLDLYDLGLVFVDDDQVHAVRYDTTVIYQEVVRHLLYGVVETKTTHDYTLLDVEGKEIRLQDYSQGGAPNAVRWGAAVQDGVTAAQLPVVAEKLYRGVTVTFGDLWLSVLEFGAGAKSVRWSQVGQIAVQSGDLRVHAQGRWLALTNTPVRKIPNVYVFLALAHRMIADKRGLTGRPAPRPAPTTPTVAPDGLHALLAMVMGNNATAERLIAYERQLLPGADRATWIVKAIERLRRDRDRQG